MFRNVALRIVLLPVYMTLLAGTVVHIETADILRSVLTLLILPLTLAGATRWLLGRANIPIQEAKERNRLPYLKTVTLMVVVIAMFASQGAVLFDNPAVVLKMILPGFAFFAFAFVISIVAARICRLIYPEFAVLVFTTKAQNSAASLAVTVTAFASQLSLFCALCCGCSRTDGFPPILMC